jgi:hypothetical protein
VLVSGRLVSVSLVATWPRVVNCSWPNWGRREDLGEGSGAARNYIHATRSDKEVWCQTPSPKKVVGWWERSDCPDCLRRGAENCVGDPDLAGRLSNIKGIWSRLGLDKTVGPLLP